MRWVDVSFVSLSSRVQPLTKPTGPPPSFQHILVVFVNFGGLDCPHTTRVAEDWASWLAQEEAEAHRTIAVSPGALSTAMGYARGKHWNVRVGAVEPAADGKGEHPLMKRTPWVFAVRHDGTVVAEGHGNRLAEVAQAIRGDWT